MSSFSNHFVWVPPEAPALVVADDLPQQRMVLPSRVNQKLWSLPELRERALKSKRGEVLGCVVGFQGQGCSGLLLFGDDKMLWSKPPCEAKGLFHLQFIVYHGGAKARTQGRSLK